MPARIRFSVKDTEPLGMVRLIFASVNSPWSELQSVPAGQLIVPRFTKRYSSLTLIAPSKRYSTPAPAVQPSGADGLWVAAIGCVLIRKSPTAPPAVA